MKGDVDSVAYRLDLKDDASRFEGGLPNAPGIAGLNASLALMEEVGFDRIHQQAWQVSGHLICGLQRLGAQLAPCALSDRTRSTIVSFQAPELERTYRFLRENRIACSMRCGYIRMGIHGYNTVEEAEQVLAALKGFWGR